MVEVGWVSGVLLTSRDQTRVLVVAVFASFVAFLDSSVIHVALPAMSAELGGGLATQQWVVNAYLLTLGSLILLAGSLSDLFGRAAVLRVGLIGFGITSVAIAVAPTAELVIVLRGLQGVAGALLVPSSLALILSAFRGERQAHAIGTWTAWTSAAMLTGPLLGGLFVDLLSWRLVFAINVIPIAITLILLSSLSRLDERKPGARVDVVGGALAVAGLGGPVWALIEYQNLGWSHPGIWIPLLVGIVALALFVWWESRTPDPMLPLSMFRNRNFSAGNLATLFIFGAMAVSSVLVTIYLQEVSGYPATLAGLAMLPVSLGVLLLSRRFGILGGRYGPRLFMTVGPLVIAAGHLLLLLTGEQVEYWTQMLPGMLVFALGVGMTLAPLTSGVLGAIPAQQAGVGSAVNNAVARVAGLITVASLGLMLGGPLGVDSFHRVLVILAGLFVIGAVISFLGIRNPDRVVVAVGADAGSDGAASMPTVPVAAGSPDTGPVTTVPTLAVPGVALPTDSDDESGEQPAAADRQ